MLAEVCGSSSHHRQQTWPWDWSSSSGRQLTPSQTWIVRPWWALLDFGGRECWEARSCLGRSVILSYPVPWMIGGRRSQNVRHFDPCKHPSRGMRREIRARISTFRRQRRSWRDTGPALTRGWISTALCIIPGYYDQKKKIVLPVFLPEIDPTYDSVDATFWKCF